MLLLHLGLVLNSLTKIVHKYRIVRLKLLMQQIRIVRLKPLIQQDLIIMIKVSSIDSIMEHGRLVIQKVKTLTGIM